MSLDAESRSGATARRADIDALAESWPRTLIALGCAEPLAQWWCESREAAVARRQCPFARHPATASLRNVLFEARRARRLSRGLEETAKTLAAQEQGLGQAPATQLAPGKRRISRLLVVSGDGSSRFYRQVEKIRRQHIARLEVIVLECDEMELGGAIFGSGRAARAILLDHKQAVVEFLGALETGLAGSANRDSR